MMAMPKNFGFGEEEQMLRDAARRFFEDRLPTDKLHKLVGEYPQPAKGPQCFWEPALWNEMVALGWTGLAVPERAGGIGMGCVAVAALAEEAGRAALPSPLIPTLQATYLLAACGSESADAALSRIAEGSAMTLALTNRQGAWGGAASDVRVSDGRLSGTAWYVQDAAKVEAYLVRAMDGDSEKLYLVEKGAAGVTLAGDAIVDLTRDQARLNLEQADAVELSDNAASIIAAAEPALFTILAADMCGAAEWQLQTTVEYAKVRQQFERQIGFFQAIKHPLVNFMMEIDIARSHTYNAACSIDCAEPGAAVAAHMAKSAASDMAAFGSGRSVQFHGGIGFTWECYVHIYFKRQNHNLRLMGDGPYHRDRLASITLGSEAA